MAPRLRAPRGARRGKGVYRALVGIFLLIFFFADVFSRIEYWKNRPGFPERELSTNLHTGNTASSQPGDATAAGAEACRSPQERLKICSRSEKHPKNVLKKEIFQDRNRSDLPQFRHFQNIRPCHNPDNLVVLHDRDPADIPRGHEMERLHHRGIGRERDKDCPAS